MSVTARATDTALRQHPTARITVVMSDMLNHSGFAHVTVVIAVTKPVRLAEIAR
jgi:hypothetical protein